MYDHDWKTLTGWYTTRWSVDAWIPWSENCVMEVFPPFPSHKTLPRFSFTLVYRPRCLHLSPGISGRWNLWIKLASEIGCLGKTFQQDQTEEMFLEGAQRRRNYISLQIYCWFETFHRTTTSLIFSHSTFANIYRQYYEPIMILTIRCHCDEKVYSLKSQTVISSARAHSAPIPDTVSPWR